MAISPFGSGFDSVWEGGEGIGAPGKDRWDVTVEKRGAAGAEVTESFRVSADSPQGALALAQETQNEVGLVYHVHPDPTQRS